ncbi:MAG: hypothetical protein IIA03_10860 [Proteobacteria bacterium]|jgi:hypothetical protein|nr:hypothetical protein [Methylibium sp.]MBY0367516.1 hypothetical protein [Burkholderiaceae bacterium]MCH8856716.1 hypothetical protein [Pseudomonadota bacterium]|mmetsp:Transcript_10473/g.42757  ORF Transcript_10473/g.42757 Transcript_10473/m.42757 type:complete len:151 (+) Transcript_10473:549-1001(+)
MHRIVSLLPSLTLPLLLTSLVAAAAAQTAGPASGNRPQTRPAVAVEGIYSDLRWIPGEADLLGFEFFIVNGGVSGYYAVLQCAEGEATRPALVKAQVTGERIEFEAHSQAGSLCPKARFVGTVSRRGLTGRFDGSDFDITLARRPRFWRR